MPGEAAFKEQLLCSNEVCEVTKEMLGESREGTWMPCLSRSAFELQFRVDLLHASRIRARKCNRTDDVRVKDDFSIVTLLDGICPEGHSICLGDGTSS